MTNIDADLPEGITSYVDRHGKRRYRFRKSGLPSKSIPGSPGDLDFTAAYEDALLATPQSATYCTIHYVGDQRRPMPGRQKTVASVRKHSRRFWHYSMRTAERARYRAVALKVPFDLDYKYIDQLFADQRWRCAISGIVFDPPKAKSERPSPFGPSLDRAIPALGYVRGNVRLVCNIVNSAMNEWGLEALLDLVNALSPRRNGDG